jgi:hypothetical protein
MREWKVYGLIDPRDATVFYVGISRNLKARLNNHIYDSASAAWPRCQRIKDDGMKAVMCVFGMYDDKNEAKITEGRLILSLPDVCNCKTAYGLPSSIINPTWHILDRPSS